MSDVEVTLVMDCEFCAEHLRLGDRAGWVKHAQRKHIDQTICHNCKSWVEDVLYEEHAEDCAWTSLKTTTTPFTWSSRNPGDLDDESRVLHRA